MAFLLNRLISYQYGNRSRDQIQDGQNQEEQDVFGKVNAYLISENKTEAEQIRLYWSIGEAICVRPERSAAVVLSEELALQFPEEKGFSLRNVRRMRECYRTCAGCPTLAIPSKEMFRLLRCLIHSPEIFCWVEDFCSVPEPWDSGDDFKTDDHITEATQESETDAVELIMESTGRI